MNFSMGLPYNQVDGIFPLKLVHMLNLKHEYSYVKNVKYKGG